MNLQSGILIGVPIPESDGASAGETIQQAIESALLQAKYLFCVEIVFTWSNLILNICFNHYR